MIIVQDTKGNEITVFTLENSGANYEEMAHEFALKHGYVALKDGAKAKEVKESKEEAPVEPKKKGRSSKKR